VSGEKSKNQFFFEKSMPFSGFVFSGFKKSTFFVAISAIREVTYVNADHPDEPIGRKKMQKLCKKFGKMS